MKKRIIALMFTAAFAAVMTACGSSSAKEEVDQPSEVVVEEDNTSEENQETEEKEEGTAAEQTETPAEDENKEYLGSKTEDGSGWKIDSCLITGQNEIIVPETISGYPVKEIGENAFAGLECTKIVLPDSVESIGTGAFSLCANLEEIDLGENLTYITSMAFYDCPKLKKLSFPESMTTIDDQIFYNNTDLEDIYIPASVTTLPSGYLFFEEFCPNAIIVTPAGSAAEKYAKEYELPYKNS